MNPIDKLIEENNKRKETVYSEFKPITGFGSIGEREELYIKDFPLQTQYLPKEMLEVPLVRAIQEEGSLSNYAKKIAFSAGTYKEDRIKVIDAFTRIRCKYDFAFWAALLVYIKNKGGGEDVHFRLNSPQRKLIAKFERMRLQGMPIRLILLKARQWGGSTATQIYMAWLQLVHKVGLNSLIVGHVKDASTEVKDMFDKLIRGYPIEMLYGIGEPYNDNEPKIVGVGQSGNIHRIPQRNCKIKVGSAERPNSARGGDYNLVHCTEVGLWVTTEGKTPEDIVRSACSGVLLKPYTMIVYESTANGTGNFFHREYEAAKNGISQFDNLFISWFEIEQYTAGIDNIQDFATKLWENRNNESIVSDREESGKYLWWLWEKGATLEAIKWYILERSKYTNHGDMASEYPSDDIEAFVHSGTMIFDKYKVEQFKPTCRPARYIGDIYADGDSGKTALSNLRFSEDKQGLLHIWDMPEIYEDEIVTNRYIVVVDIGGRSRKADFSVILVIDRLFMIYGDKPVVVAQWYGHIDMDILAWKAVQVATFYDKALLVIESNTLETRDKERQVDGDQSHFILNQIKDVYPNLYARKQSEEAIREGLPRKYGFHTNIATKPMIISTLIKAIRDNLYIERDERCLDEYLYYEKKKNGAFGAIDGKHDDLLMTRAIGLHICFFEMDMPAIHPRLKFRNEKSKPITEATI